jgi:hypothetical protein
LINWLRERFRAWRREPAEDRAPPTRERLIAEKEAVVAEMASLRASARTEAEVEARLQALMAEERRLRLLIDRSGRR